MKESVFDRMIGFLHRLQVAKIAYRLRHSRPEAITIDIDVPGERWEVEFLDDGSVDVECFLSDGGVQDESKLDDLFARFSDADPVNEDAARTRN